MNQTKQHKRYFRWLPLLAVVLAAAGCTSEEREVTEKSLTNSPVTLGFTLHLPEDSTSTRAMTGAEEKEIKSLAVLVFKETAPGVEVFDDKINVAPSTISASGRFEVPVKILSERQRFVLIANASDQIDRLSAAGQAKEGVLQALVVKETGKWNAVSASTYRPMPMWGETGLLTISAPGQSAGTIYLHRMLAKINITIDPSIPTSTFALEEVYLYNRNTRGRLVPDAANWDPTTNNGQATAATLPPDTDAADPLTVHSHKTAWKYDNADGLTPTAINNAIYLFETKADNTDRLKTFALVVGGKYNGATTTTYYRLDIKEATTRNYIDLLRNHNYRVTIDAVNGGGAADPDDAFKGEITLGASVNVWNNASPGDLIDNGQYMLSLSQMKYELTRDARTATDEDNKLTITTDYVNDTNPTQGGWTATVWADEAGTTPVPNDGTTGAPWFSLSTTSGTGNYPTGDQLYFHMAENRTTTPRTAWIHVKAGRLTAKVEVTQTTRGRFYIYTVDGSGNEVTDVVFAAGPGVTPTPQNITVNWKPESANLGVVNSTLGSTPFPSGVGEPTTATIPGGTGTYTYTITPPALTAAELASDPFLEKTSQIDFTVNDGTVNLSHSLTLRQLAYNLVVQQPTSYYRLDGSTYTIYVRSNTNWRIKSVSETVTTGSGNLLQSANDLHAGFTGGANTAFPGTPVTFTVTNNPVNLRGTLTIVFESTDSPGHFNDVTLVLGEYYPEPHKGWAGSNIYWDGSKMTFDDTNDNAPNKNYGGLFFQWGSLYGLDPSTTNWRPSCIVYTPDNTTTTGKAWTAIPRVGNDNITSTPPSGKTARDRHYLGEIYDPANGLGDICRHITEMNGGTLHGKKWRMPTSNEFEAAGDYGTWSGSGGTPRVDGKGAIVAGRAKNTDIGKPRFPAAGYRDDTWGQLRQLGSSGCYWAGSPFTTDGFALRLSNSLLNPGNYSLNRGTGFSVRCVQE